MGQHGNAPLTPEGRRRLCERVDAGRPIAHVAAEAGISRRCLSKWYGRWKQFGDGGLEDHSSRPRTSPNATRDGLVELVIALRRAKKWGPARIAAALELDGIDIAPATVHRILVREGISRVRDMDPPTGEQADRRRPVRLRARHGPVACVARPREARQHPAPVLPVAGSR